ncbi:cytochrome P450 [Massariosphaeria phaeospora]|uniref:Cytochrome P450 n=1 Tax=Massariosphaeria phaeospora TaxID=100035 RepID=A0A7C8IA90_9PLEO|nr:cytochrome P450 [Massariosphaeria phaeospora]
MAEFLRTTDLDELIRSNYFVALLGLISHYVLNHGEWDKWTHILLPSWVLAFGALAVVEYFFNPYMQSLFQVVRITSGIAIVYFGSLLTSMLVYRGMFHPLGKFPGPFLSRLSKFYSVHLVLKNIQYYNEVEKLHKDYNSDIVRTGPRELSIISPDAISLVHGPSTKCTKGPFYNGPIHLEGTSLMTERDVKKHAQRRRLWDRAFNVKSLRDYVPRVNRHTQALMEKLKEHADESSLCISDWLNYYSFDVMGDIVFSRSFGMLENGREDNLIKALHKSMSAVCVMSQINWLPSLLFRSPVGLQDMLNFITWAGKVLKERKKKTPKENDIFGWLLDPNDENVPMDLNADSRLLIVAGSDTTAATLTWLCYELCKNLDVQFKLRDIVDRILPEKAFLDVEDLANCPHLDGVIKEALRLHPAVPSGLQRETPPSGLTLSSGVYIPGNTLIWMPTHTLQRSASSYRSPLTFMPERWTDEASDHVLDKRAFLAFSAGANSCIGQKLAMLEMRAVTANLVRNFDMRFSEADDGTRLEKETADCFTINVGKLEVSLKRRG